MTSPAGDIDALRRGAIESHRRGDLIGAEAALQKLLLASPADADALYRLGLITHARGEHDLAAQRLTAALAQ